MGEPCVTHESGPWASHGLPMGLVLGRAWLFSGSVIGF